MTDNLNAVPTLDLRRFDSDRDAFVRQLGESYEKFGFCGFSHHGIPQDLVDKACAQFKAFFDLPLEVKEQYGGIEGGARGYIGFGTEVAKDSEHFDLKEFWHVGRAAPAGHPYADRMPANVWPEELPEFKSVALALYNALNDLGMRILRAMALHLNIDEHWFDDKVNEGNSILRPLHYPPVSDPDTPCVRAAAHEDINLITLLLGSEQAGLEILRRDGSWVPVTSIPNTVVVNIGDMMQRLTNHVFPSTTHRVVNPVGETARHSRYSIPFFLHPNPDFIIDTLPTCISEDNPNRYPEPLASHDYLMQRLKEIGLL